MLILVLLPHFCDNFLITLVNYVTLSRPNYVTLSRPNLVITLKLSEGTKLEKDIFLFIMALRWQNIDSEQKFNARVVRS